MKTAREILQASGALAPQTVAAKLGGKVVDLAARLDEGARVEPVEAGDSPDALAVLRHSVSHVMADAVQRLFPGTMVTIGPSIEEGFYYDFDRPSGPFADEELAAIEATMREIVEERSPFVRREVSRGEARALFEKLGEPYKLELLDDIPEGETVTLYSHGAWTDLCAGPHLVSTERLRHFTLQKTAGAYWRGDEKRKMLSRIYGTAFYEKASLDAHLARIEEARKRDHRRLGTDLDLFSIVEEIGGGLVLWHPRGAFVRHKIEEMWRRAHLAHGYEIVYTPHIGRTGLWEKSGHMGFYRQNMYPPVELEGLSYMLKPMNCPFHITIYKSRVRSWRDLPLRWAELGTVYRYEKSGQMHGLLRVRGFTQDDAHLFCRREEMGPEIVGTVRFSTALLRAFGFEEFHVRLATRPREGFIGDPALWDEAERHLRAALEVGGFAYEVDEGGGAFYGPKIDIDVKDVLGRPWQCTTVQLDFNLPQRFDLRYSAADGSLAQPIMIHRALLGSMERFFGVLIEHYAGAFPPWLAPEQVVLVNVTGAQEEFTRACAAALGARGLRVRTDLSGNKLGAKIKDARLLRVPYIGVVGERERESGSIALRGRVEGEMGARPLEEAAAFLVERCRDPEFAL